MAYIAKTAFEARVTNNEFNDLCNVAGKFQEGSPLANAVCSAGMLVKRNGKLPCEGFTSIYNENAWYMKAAVSTDNCSEVIYAANPYDVNIISDATNGAFYAVGSNTLGLPVPSGRIGNFTVVNFDGQHIYRFGEGNVDGTVGANTYFTIDDGQLSPTATAPTDNGAIYFKLNGTGKFTVGATQGDTYYDVIACQVHVAAE